MHGNSSLIAKERPDMLGVINTYGDHYDALGEPKALYARRVGDLSGDVTDGGKADRTI